MAVTARAMDHDDDVEHLFSWLQTPELRYREFAGAREITDSVVIIQQQRASNTPIPEDRPIGAPHHDTQLNEEYPTDQFPDQGETRVEVREEAKIEVREEVRGAGRGPLIIPPEPVEGGALLGGAYREGEAAGHGAGAAPAEPPTAPGGQQQGNERSLDAVFGRLSGGRGRLPDPRERARHISGFGPPAGRPR